MSKLPDGKISIELYLKEQCIETAAKKELRYLTGHYFNREEEQNDLLEKIELLQAFIEKSDFPKLRSVDERLSGTREVFVRITQVNGDFILDIE
jgi:hypothetical protein